MRITLFFVCLTLLYSCKEVKRDNKGSNALLINELCETRKSNLENALENPNLCVDTLVLNSDFPCFPFGERFITREWVAQFFKIKIIEIQFKGVRSSLNDSYVDSIFTLKKGESNIEICSGAFYNPLDSIYNREEYNSLTGEQRPVENKYLSQPYGIINDSSIILANDIKIGISKEMFFGRLDISNVNRGCNTFFITDSEWQCYHKFYFNNNTLYKIELKFLN